MEHLFHLVCFFAHEFAVLSSQPCEFSFVQCSCAYCITISECKPEKCHIIKSFHCLGLFSLLLYTLYHILSDLSRGNCELFVKISLIFTIVHVLVVIVMNHFLCELMFSNLKEMDCVWMLKTEFLDNVISHFVDSLFHSITFLSVGFLFFYYNKYNI